MKNLNLLLLAGLLAVAPVVSYAQQEMSRTGILDASEAKSLARGYAQAFESLNKSTTITLVLHRDGKTFAIRDVRAVSAVDGVLLVTVGGVRERYVVNPRDVLYFTDSPSNNL